MVTFHNGPNKESCWYVFLISILSLCPLSLSLLECAVPFSLPLSDSFLTLTLTLTLTISTTTTTTLQLNTGLTVRAHSANSHKNAGWQKFTDSVMKKLNEHESPIVFILWGRHAQDKAKFITEKRHLILKSAHPSGLSAHRGFFGSKPFSKTNEFLEKHSLAPIDWSIK